MFSSVSCLEYVKLVETKKKKTEFIKVLKTVPIAKSNLMTLNFDSTMMVVSNIQVIK